MCNEKKKKKNVFNDDSNIDHKRWSKRYPPKGGPNIKKTFGGLYIVGI